MVTLRHLSERWFPGLANDNGAGPRSAAGHVRPAAGEEVIDLLSESAKLALGITELSGPVTVFVPRDLLAQRDRAQTPEQQRLLQVHAFFLYSNVSRGSNAAL